MSRAARLFVVGGVMAAMPVISHALGLGNLTVDSALNESLKAEIEFTSANRKELKSLNVTLAPRGAFDTAGIQWLPYLSDIKFTVARRLDGRSFIQLTSEQPIREPFLHFLPVDPRIYRIDRPALPPRRPGATGQCSTNQ
jgi:pilus assembly protein FimV